MVAVGLFKGCFEENIDYIGGDITGQSRVETAEECQSLCQNHPNCLHWTWVKETQR